MAVDGKSAASQKSSQISAVLNTVTADDIKYQGVEINTTVMKRKAKIVQQWDMDEIEKYDANGVFEKTMKGKFTQLD